MVQLLNCNENRSSTCLSTIFPSSHWATGKRLPSRMVCFEASAPARPNYSRKREHCYLNEDVSWVPHCEKRPLVDDAVGCYARKVSPTMANH